MYEGQMYEGKMISLSSIPDKKSTFIPISHIAKSHVIGLCASKYGSVCKCFCNM